MKQAYRTKQDPDTGSAEGILFLWSNSSIISAVYKTRYRSATQDLNLPRVAPAHQCMSDMLPHLTNLRLVFAIQLFLQCGQDYWWRNCKYLWGSRSRKPAWQWICRNLWPRGSLNVFNRVGHIPVLGSPGPCDHLPVCGSRCCAQTNLRKHKKEAEQGLRRNSRWNFYLKM